MARHLFHLWFCVFAIASFCNVKAAVPDSQRRPLQSTTLDVDIALHGACSADILYHCAHILTEEQKRVVHGDSKSNSAVPVRSSTTSFKRTAGDEAAGSASNAGVLPADEEEGLLQPADDSMVDEEDEDMVFEIKDTEGDAVDLDAVQRGGRAGGDGGDTTNEEGAEVATAAEAKEEQEEVEEEDDDGMQITEEGLMREGERRLAGRGIRAVASTKPRRARAAADKPQQRATNSVSTTKRRNAAGDPKALLRREAAGGGGVWGNVEDEAAQLLQQQGSLPAVLQRFGLDNAPVRDLAAANAPVARCLRHAIHQGLLSLSPDAPHVGADCKLDVRNFFVQRSTDIRRDLPLLASCASDIEELCAGVTSPQKVLGCLKSAKNLLVSVCRSAVTTHQIESAEDISLDPDLAASCTADRERLCSHVGWGEGAAQACLLSHIYAASSRGGSSSQQGDAVAASGVQGRVSAACDAALFRRQMQDSEDIRFNYQLARACSMDRQALCSGVRPGAAGVLGCLERHLADDRGTLDEACSSAMRLQLQGHAQDARLDYRFLTSCRQDVAAHCTPEEAGLVLNQSAPRGAGAAMLECLRAKQDSIRDAECKKHVFDVSMAMYHDNTLDSRLQSACTLDMGRCRNPATAISCLRDSSRRYGDISPACQSIVTLRLTEAASDLAFNPALRDACAAERLAFCSHAFLQGGAVIDCLADSRNMPSFSDGCRSALLTHLEHAVTDIRMMASLRTACQADISELCVGVAPGDGRVIGCLRQKRGQVTSRACRAQILRLLGYVVEDARMDFQLMQACRPDAQQFCAGITGGGGLLHECLRDSWDHLSKECKQAEAQVESIEHEDVRLNPRLQRACPHATAMFCHSITPGDANVISCLVNNMNKPNFPTGCKKALSKLLDRSSTRYTLNPRLKRACEQDRATTCSNTVDDPESSELGAQDTTLGCLASNSSVVQPECRAEIAAAVKVQLTRFRMGMPLTSVCDSDVMKLCSVDKLTASFLERGYVQACLVKHVSGLQAPCFALISIFDDKQFGHAVDLENKWKGGMRDEQLQQVAAEVRRELELHMMDQVTNKITHEVKQGHNALMPRIDALLNSVAVLLLIVIIVMGAAAYAFRKQRRGMGSFVIKNASN